MVLRRIVGKGPAAQPIDVQCRAVVRPVKAEDLIGTVTQADSIVILSPTQIIAAQWPGGEAAAGAEIGDRRVPTTDDKVLLRRVPRQIMFVKPLYVQNELVRIELTVKG